MKFFLFLAICVRPTVSQEGTFNTEISGRVVDFVQGYLSSIALATYVPYHTIYDGAVPVNLSNHVDTSQKAFLSVKRTFKQLSNMYAAFENNDFYGYLLDTYQNNIKLVLGPNTKPRASIIFAVNKDGTPGKYLGYQNLTCTTRVWYKAGKAAKAPVWSPVYYSTTTKTSVFNFMLPLFKNQSDPKTFIGLLNSAAYLTDVTSFLTQSYKGTNRLVFIMDNSTGQLLANNMGEPTNIPGTTRGSIVSTMICNIIPL